MTLHIPDIDRLSIPQGTISPPSQGNMVRHRLCNRSLLAAWAMTLCLRYACPSIIARTHHIPLNSAIWGLKCSARGRWLYVLCKALEFAVVMGCVSQQPIYDLCAPVV